MSVLPLFRWLWSLHNVPRLCHKTSKFLLWHFFHFSSKKDDFTRLNWNHFTNIFRNLFRVLADVKNSDLLVFLNARSRKWHKCSEIGSKRLLACVWSTLREENKLGRKECGIKGALSGLIQFLTTVSPLKIDEKYFLFHFESSFRSQDI